MAENDEILMTNDEGMCKPERTNGKRGHPERIPPSREESKDPAIDSLTYRNGISHACSLDSARNDGYENAELIFI